MVKHHRATYVNDVNISKVELPDSKIHMKSKNSREKSGRVLIESMNKSGFIKRDMS
jgi:hypothetical protein